MEQIKHAAIRTVDEYIITGKDHGRCIQKAVELGLATIGEGRIKQNMQGFVTDNYRFIGRKEALALGLKNGQIDKRMVSNDEAFSEMLWMEEIYYGKHHYDKRKGYFIP